MNVEECYTKIGGSYATAVRLFKTDERIIKYFKIMQKDTNLDVLCKALEQNDYETAFCAAHTLKGLALNMQFTALADEVSALTELLRPQRGKRQHHASTFQNKADLSNHIELYRYLLGKYGEEVLL